MSSLKNRAHRYGFRLATELGFAFACIPVLVLSALLLPLPWLAVALAEVERRRTAKLDKGTTPYVEAAGGWGPWFAHRTFSLAMLSRDVPLATVSTLLGFGSLLAWTALVILLGFAGTFAVETFMYGGWRYYISPVELFIIIPLSAALLSLNLLLILVVSRVRDAVVVGISGDETVELQRQLSDVQVSRASMLDAFENERRRIERDLHDGAQQDLVALSITLGALEMRALKLDGEAREGILLLSQRAHASADSALSRLRETVHGIHPRELTDHGLFAAVGEVAARSPLRTTVTTRGYDAHLSPSVAGAIFFAVSEGLTNVAKHSGVDRAAVHVEVTDSVVFATVADPGKGGAQLQESDGKIGGTGLTGLRERMRALGGDLQVSSSSAGTTIKASAPVRMPWKDKEA